MYTIGSGLVLVLTRWCRDFHSPYGVYSGLATIGRENSCLLSREMGPSGCYPPHRASSNRLLMNASLDQRIIKQSTEDCRRLLQQATAVADPTRKQTTKPTNMELDSTPPKHPTNGVTTIPPPQNSKSSIPNFCSRFQMSVEARKLFQSLQQSPLPVNQDVSAVDQNRYNADVVMPPAMPNKDKSPREAKDSPQTKDSRGNIQQYVAYTPGGEGESNSFQMIRHSQIIQQPG